MHTYNYQRQRILKRIQCLTLFTCFFFFVDICTCLTQNRKHIFIYACGLYMHADKKTNKQNYGLKIDF